MPGIVGHMAEQQLNDLLADLEDKVRRRRDEVSRGAAPQGVAVPSPAQMPGALRRLGLSGRAGFLDQQGWQPATFEDPDRWPEGLVVAEDLTWVVEGRGQERTLHPLT